MPSFKGKATNSVDNKGRIAIPAKMRKAMKPECQDTFVMTRGFDKCIALYPIDVWEELEAYLKSDNLNKFGRQPRQLTRLFMQFAGEVTLDGQGRIMLSQDLMEIAGIGKNALVCGVMERIEVWNPDRYAEALEISEDDLDFEDLAEAVMGQALRASSDKAES